MDLTLKFLLPGVGISSAFVAGVITARTTANSRVVPIPVLTLVCFLVVSAFSLAQMVFAPDLLPLLRRDAVRVYADEPWRMVTSLLVQDGGWAGAAFNLVALLVLGTVAERILGWRRWAVTAAISVASAQLLALMWQPTGAGNSILNCGLAGAICAVALMDRRSCQAFAPTIAASVCFALLLVARDIHGVAAAAGALVTGAYSLRGQRHDADKTVH